MNKIKKCQWALAGLPSSYLQNEAMLALGQSSRKFCPLGICSDFSQTNFLFFSRARAHTHTGLIENSIEAGILLCKNAHHFAFECMPTCLRSIMSQRYCNAVALSCHLLACPTSLLPPSLVTCRPLSGICEFDSSDCSRTRSTLSSQRTEQASTTCVPPYPPEPQPAHPLGTEARVTRM